MKKSELVTLVAEKTGFSKKDTEKTIDTLTEKNVIKGFEDSSFQPDKLVTRAQMAKMMFVLRTSVPCGR